jgi:prepilin-type N-terminal cleavage/methylation domain-containing protein
MLRTTTRKIVSGFTLVELLVVIGIIALLISILLPALFGVRKQAERTVCASKMRQLGQAVHMYAGENKGKVPTGKRDGDGYEHCIFISAGTYDALSLYVGNRKSTSGYDALIAAGQNGETQIDRFIGCPANVEENAQNQLPSRVVGYGWLIGYDYLGGHSDFPNGWKSPKHTSDSSSLPLFSDFNDYSPPDGWVIISHRKKAGGGFFYPAGGARSPINFDGIGGNVCSLDGSVVWKTLSDMYEHDTTPSFAVSTTPSGTTAGAYRGLW